jgi:hypothetical protein
MYLFASEAWEAERNHLRNLWLVAHTVGLGPQVAIPPERVLDFAVESALGNMYRYDAARDEIVGSTTGSLWNPTIADRIPENSPANRLLDMIRNLHARLEFTEDGLRTDLTVQRTGP